MRTCLAFFSVVLGSFSVAAQDNSAAQAAQQAAEQSQQAAMQAMHDAQQANQLAAEAAQNAAQNAQTSTTSQPCCVAWTAPPKFSIKAGKYPGAVTVKITDSSRGAVIYYSTDGWTPTADSSPQYRGPVVIDSTATLQAIAIAPYSMRSVVTSAQYVIASVPSNSSSLVAAAASPNIPPNLIAVPLVFDAEVSSKTASVGDKIPMILSQDLTIGTFLVKKGTPASVTITQVDRTGIGGAPGSLSFEAEDLHPQSGPIPLQGGATRDGDAKIPNATVLIPVVGPFAILRHGTDAVITKGTPFTAYIDSGTSTAAAQQ